MRARLVAAPYAVLLGITVLGGTARAQNRAAPATLFEAPLPGGLRDVLATIQDPIAPDRGQFLVEVIRRWHRTPLRPKGDEREAAIQAVVERLRLASAAGGPSESLPLPLPPSVWIDAVFGGRATVETLVAAILQSRGAALLYTGLLSLDDETRAWLATQPDLVGDLASRHASAFLIAAPGLRVAGTSMQVPGGQPAEPAWEALVGRRVREPAEFIRALLTQDEGRLAYFVGAIAQLTPMQIQFALGLDAREPSDGIATLREFYGVYQRIALRWLLDKQPYWRPTLDPSLLIAELPAGDDGRPIVPGTPRFWRAVFSGDAAGSDLRELAVREPVSVAWLCDQVFTENEADRRRRYRQVLFASRVLRDLTPESVHDALDAVRAFDDYPALTATLERARVADVTAIAAAARRAARISGIGDRDREARALAQFQGLLAVIVRAVRQGSLAAGTLPPLVSSLAAIDVSARGDYEGRLVKWLDSHLLEWRAAAPSPTRPHGDGEDVYASAADPVERDLLRLLSGPPPAEPRLVDWEGTRYRLDLAHAEAIRLSRLLGDSPRPLLSWARALVGVADALAQDGLGSDQLRRLADGLTALEASEPERGDAPAEYREIAAALQRAARGGDVRGAQRLAPSLRLAADDLLARGLVELVYAIALGNPERALVPAADAAKRHDFGLRPAVGRPGPWEFPSAGSDPARGWHATGSLLGLDIRLSDFALVRVSLKALPNRPSLNAADRRLFFDAVALIEPASLSDRDRDAIVTAMKAGRERLGALRATEDAGALADRIRLSPARRTLLAWTVLHDRSRLDAFLSPSELFELGSDTTSRFDDWGVPAEPRLGCLCVRLIGRRSPDSLAGRWNSGIFATGFPDLNLRLTELLSELAMPAPLLGPVLASATPDFVDTATSRDDDDRRGLVEYVQALRRERVEEYLALLTTDGPLVAVGDAPQQRPPE